MEFIEGVIIGLSIRKLYIDGWIPCLHELHIYDKPSCPAIAVDEWMDVFKLNVKTSYLGHYMLTAFCVRAFPSIALELYVYSTVNSSLSLAASPSVRGLLLGRLYHFIGMISRLSEQYCGI